MAVGGLPLHFLVSAHPASPPYGLDHHCRAVKMSTTWRGLLRALLMLVSNSMKLPTFKKNANVLGGGGLFVCLFIRA